VSTDTGRLELEGRLAGEWVAELRRVAIAIAGDQPERRAILDLTGLQSADAAGIALLGELRAGGAQLEHGPEFVLALVTGGDDVSDR
jgi:hypothetical protein